MYAKYIGGRGKFVPYKGRIPFGKIFEVIGIYSKSNGLPGHRDGCVVIALLIKTLLPHVGGI